MMSELKQPISTPSSPESESSCCPKLYDATDELQDVLLVKEQPDDGATSVTTPFGSVKSGQYMISVPFTATLQKRKGVSHALESKWTEPREKPPPMAARLARLCVRKQLTDQTEFYNAIHTDEEVCDFYAANAHTQNWSKALVGALQIAYNSMPLLTYEQRVQQVPDGRGAVFEEYVKQWKLFINDTIGVPKFGAFIDVMCMRGGKIKTIYMVGSASGGKSCVISLLTSVYRFSEIGKASAQSISSSFWLADMINKRVGVMDEVVATQVNVDALKMIMEGNYFSDTDVKFGGRVKLSPMPILIACNLEICRMVQGHASAINARCVKHEFNKKTPYKIHSDDRVLLSQILKRLIEDIPVEERPVPPPVECLIVRIGRGDDVGNLTVLDCACPDCAQ